MIVFLNPADSLGKVEKSLLAPETLMDLLIENLENGNKIITNAPYREDFSSWRGVKVKEGSILGIFWHNFGLQGSMDLQWAP